MWMRISLTLNLLLATLTVCRGDDSPPSEQDLQFFETRIRPVLVERCYSCHSAESEELAGNLRLDLRSGWQQGGDSGSAAVVPGDPDASLLLKALRHDADVSAMPPDQPRLSDAVLRDFTRWIAAGAADPRTVAVTRSAAQQEREQEFAERRTWWSLQSPVRPALPDVADKSAIRTDVDRFIQSRLEREQIQPAAEADAEVLIRRLSFALTGLPPSVDLLQRYRDSDWEAAFPRLVDELLADPAFGERWARHWMDVVHYTDTHGYEWDVPVKNSWRYRDYLIRAFNQDLAWDRLAQEQIAGDLLPPRIDPATGLNEALIGPLMLRLGERRHGDNSAIEGVSQEAVSSMIDTLGKGFLGTTLACAQCHDHKLDAVRQTDYYSLAGMLMSTRFSSRSLETVNRNESLLGDLRGLKSEIRQQLSAVWLEALAAGGGTLSSAVTAMTQDKPAPAGVPLSLADMALGLRHGSVSGAAFLAERQRRLQSNAEHTHVLADFAADGETGGWAWDGSGMQTGLADHGTLVIAAAGETVLQHLLPAGRYSHLWSATLPGVLQSPAMDATQPMTFAVEGVAGQKASQSFIVDQALNPERMQFPSRAFPAWQSLTAGRFDSLEGTHDTSDRRVYFELATKQLNNYFPPRVGYGGMQESDVKDPASWFGVSRVVRHDPGHPPLDELGRFTALFSDDAAQAEWTERLRLLLQESVVRWQRDECSGDDVQLLNEAVQLQLLPNSSTGNETLQQLVTKYRELQAQLQPDRTAGSVAEWNEGRDERLAIRGSYTSLGDTVPRAQLSFLGRTEGVAAGSGRLQWAQLITRPDNPLFARVYVNRVWHYLFGIGLVRTPDDFGHLGEPSEHPELLDWLAIRFIENGWSTKTLIRELVLSSVWRRSSQPDPAALDRDPENRLWHYRPLRRLEAEAIRDSLLAASGRLDRQLFGPPVEPWRTAEDDQKRLFRGPLDGNGRRSVYLEMTLMEPPRFLALFNQPLPKLTVGRRDVTNVPDQALAMLNDPLVTEMARVWSEQLVQLGHQTATERAEQMLESALGRLPQPEEVRELAELAQQSADIRGDTSELLRNQAAWQDAAHAVFNLKEFLYVR